MSEGTSDNPNPYMDNNSSKRVKYAGTKKNHQRIGKTELKMLKDFLRMLKRGEERKE